MAVVLVELDVVGQLADLTVDAHPRETFGRQAADQLGVGSLFAAHHGRHQLIAGSLRQQQDLIDHLVDALRLDRAAAFGAVGFTSPAEQKTQIILNLGDGAHRGTGVVTGGFLINRDRRRQALDGIHIGLVHLPQKLAGIGRQTFDVAALPLRKDRVEGERTLAASAHPGEHHQLVAGNGDVDVFEVVLPGTPHSNHIVLSRQRAS